MVEFYNSLPHYPFCTDNFSKGVYRKPKEVAGECRYVQFNTKVAIKWLVLDLDIEHSSMLWQEKGLPPPAWVASTPETGRCHISWELSVPIAASSKARSAPLDYFNAIKKAYRINLGADPSFAGLLTKNPMHPHWEVLTFNDSKPTPWQNLPALSL